MTDAELQALAEILHRMPMSAAERLWLTALFARLQAALRAAPPEPVT